jgi:cobalt-zinc-cadmium efflux system outer membrane protein
MLIEQKRAYRVRAERRAAACALRVRHVGPRPLSEAPGFRRVPAEGEPLRTILRRLRLLAALGLASGCQHFDPEPLRPRETAAAFEARSLDAPGLREFLASAGPPPLDAWPLDTWDLASLTLAAVYYSPSLELARTSAGVASAAIVTAGQRPNPTLFAGPETSANAGTATSPWLATIQLDWPIETAGKRGHRIARAEAAAAATRQAVLTEAWSVRHTLYGLLLELETSRARIAVLEREAETGRRLCELLDRRIEAGAAAQTDAAPLRLAWLQSVAALEAARAAASDLMARAAAVVGIPAAELERVQRAPLPAVASSPLLGVTRAAALEAALFVRADVQAALDDYDAAEAALALELAKQIPDVHIGPGYQFDQGQHKWTLGLSVELPILNQNEGPIAEAVAARHQAGARFGAVQANVVAEVDQALARRAGAKAELERLEVVAGDRARNVARIQKAVELGAADRSADVSAQLEALRAERAVVDAGLGLARALVDLEAAIQRPLAEPEKIQWPRREAGDHA